MYKMIAFQLPCLLNFALVKCVNDGISASLFLLLCFHEIIANIIFIEGSQDEYLNHSKLHDKTSSLVSLDYFSWAFIRVIILS